MCIIDAQAVVAPMRILQCRVLNRTICCDPCHVVGFEISFEFGAAIGDTNPHTLHGPSPSIHTCSALQTVPKIHKHCGNVGHPRCLVQEISGIVFNLISSAFPGLTSPTGWSWSRSKIKLAEDLLVVLVIVGGHNGQRML